MRLGIASEARVQPAAPGTFPGSDSASGPGGLRGPDSVCSSGDCTFSLRHFFWGTPVTPHSLSRASLCCISATQYFQEDDCQVPLKWKGEQ